VASLPAQTELAQLSGANPPCPGLGPEDQKPTFRDVPNRVPAVLGTRRGTRRYSVAQAKSIIGDDDKFPRIVSRNIPARDREDVSWIPRVSSFLYCHRIATATSSNAPSTSAATSERSQPDTTETQKTSSHPCLSQNLDAI
jgi:hypothetical protein